MSNRSLLEINHDISYKIEESPEAFIRALIRYTASANPDTKAVLENYGVRVFGMRHHSEGFDIKWGHSKASEPESRRS